MLTINKYELLTDYTSYMCFDYLADGRKHTHIRTHIHTPLYTQHARASLSLCFSLSLPLFLSFFLSLPLGKGETKGVESKEEKKKRRKEEGKKTTRRHPWTTQLFYALIDLSTCTVNSGLLNYRRDGS